MADADGAPSDSLPSFFKVDTQTGNHTGYFRIEMDTAGNTELSAESVEFNFSPPVSGLNFALLDVDFSNGNWEDYAQVVAEDANGNRVPFLSTFDSGTNLARMGDWTEADVGASATQTIGNQRYRFMDSVASVRISYAQGNQPAANSSQQFIGIEDFTFCAFDYGDGPTTYGTTTARHALRDRTRLFIGAAAPDGEAAAGQPGGGPAAGATGDGADEAALTFPPYEAAPLTMTCGSYTTAPGDYCMQVSATNNLATAAQLVGFIDFNGDGDFDDAGERSTANLGGGAGGAADGTWNTGNIAASSGTATYVLVWTGFAAPTTNPTLGRFRITTDASFFNNGTPPPPASAVSNGEMEDHAINAGTLPVTLAFVEAARLDAGRIVVDWSAATETGTMGYRILQDVNGRMVPLGSELTPSTRLSGTTPASYRETLITSSNGPVYVEELSASGKTERFGPFHIGVATGARPTVEPAPWVEAATQVGEHEVLDRAMRIERSRSRGASAVAEIQVSETGLQRVAVSDLLAAGLNLSGLPDTALRLSHAGAVIPIRVVGGGTIGANSILEFYGKSVEGSRYTRTRPYHLAVAEGGAPWTAVSGAPVAGLAALSYRRTVTLDQNRFYDLTAPGDDPWYQDEIVRTGATAGKNWTLSTPAVEASEGAELALDLWGGSAYADADPDHRYRVLLNGVELGERSFDGIATHRNRFAIAPGTLLSGNNTVRIELLATGQAIDRTYVNSISIDYRTTLAAQAGRLTIDGSKVRAEREGLLASSFEENDGGVQPCGAGCGQMQLTGFTSPDLVAIQLTDAGPVELTNMIAEQNGGQWSVRVRPLAFGTGEDEVPFGGTLVVTERASAFQPSVLPGLALGSPLEGGPAQLLIISSARFAGSVGSLVAARQAEGLTVRVVEVAQVYQHYSNGIVDAEALKAFVADAYAQLGTRYVLLVGGDTYDYFNYLNLGSVSDVPTLYRRTHEFVSHAPVDSEFGDVDGDGKPEVAVGRLPARTSAELAGLIEKVLAPLPSNPYSISFAAERTNVGDGVDYADRSDALIASLGAPWQSAVSRVYLDNYPAGSSGTAAARADFTGQVNAGRNWISFYGHASPATWSREILLQGSQLNSLLSNTGKAPLVTEFGCWGGYFVEPAYTTMNHAWLLTPGKGARAMIASSSLTETASDQAISVALTEQLREPGIRLGDALINAKASVWSRTPEMRDVVFGMSLFGDPTARLTPVQ